MSSDTDVRKRYDEDLDSIAPRFYPLVRYALVGLVNKLIPITERGNRLLKEHRDLYGDVRIFKES